MPAPLVGVVTTVLDQHSHHEDYDKSDRRLCSWNTSHLAFECAVINIRATYTPGAAMTQSVAPYALSSRFTTAAPHTYSPPAQSIDPMAALQQQVSSLLEKSPCAAYASHQHRQPSVHVPKLLLKMQHIAVLKSRACRFIEGCAFCAGACPGATPCGGDCSGGAPAGGTWGASIWRRASHTCLHPNLYDHPKWGCPTTSYVIKNSGGAGRPQPVKAWTGTLDGRPCGTARRNAISGRRWAGACEKAPPPPRAAGPSARSGALQT